MKNRKKLCTAIIFIFAFCSTSFCGTPKLDPSMLAETKKVEPIQKKYDSLAENTPVYIMIQSSGTTAIIPELNNLIQDKVNRAMINTEKMKPVLLDKWLLETYGTNKSTNLMEFVKVLSGENYPLDITGICHPYVFKISEEYVIMLSFYKLKTEGFPYMTFRKIKRLSDAEAAVEAMLNEYINVTENKSDTMYPKKKVIVKPFILECRKYAGQSTGEFDYIPSPFIEQDSVIIQSEDDFFSHTFAYSLNTTQMLDSLVVNDIPQFTDTKFTSYKAADYYVEGRVQLTDQVNIYHVSLFDAKTNQKIKDVKYFTSDFTIVGNWIANMNLVYGLADYLFGKDNYGICPDINVPGQGLYINNMFIGWDKIENFILPRGKHIIYTGTYFNQDNNAVIKNRKKAVDINGSLYRSFFLYLDERNWLFRGKDGDRVWNLMEK